MLRYLQSIISRSLLYSFDSSLSFRASDVGWADVLNTRLSTIGYGIFLDFSLISWYSKRQVVVSPSSTEDEYHAMMDTALKLRWLHDLLCNTRPKLILINLVISKVPDMDMCVCIHILIPNSFYYFHYYYCSKFNIIKYMRISTKNKSLVISYIWMLYVYVYRYLIMIMGVYSSL